MPHEKDAAVKPGVTACEGGALCVGVDQDGEPVSEAIGDTAADPSREQDLRKRIGEVLA